MRKSPAALPLLATAALVAALGVADTVPRVADSVPAGAEGAGVAAGTGAAGGEVVDDAGHPADGFAPTLTEPRTIRSEGGVLETTLTARMARIEVAGRPVVARVYNGAYIPPTLRVRPGDTIRLRLVNEIDQPTNMHYHGVNVSPRGNADDIFLQVARGDTFRYEVAIPEGHPAGLFWYRSHAHDISEFQVMSGLSGGLIVEGLLDPIPALRGIEERLLLLKDIQITSDGRIPEDIDCNAGTTRTVNGQVAPVLTIRPGETQLWRIGNVGADIFYRLRLDGHTLYEIARDGNRHNRILPRDEIVVPPSARVEVLVRGGPEGVYQLRTLYYDTGPAGDQYPEVPLATLVSTGAAETPIALPESLPPVEDLRSRTPTARRTIVFSETEGDDDGDDQTFFIDGRTFDPDRIDTDVALGALEEWTVRNESDEQHVFHIHQVDFQVIEVDGEPQPFVGYQDTQITPVRGEIKVLIPFTNPVIAGKFIYHCHIMAHEDNGMMAVIRVRDG